LQPNLGPYQLGKELARGGQGVVYQAALSGLNTPLAIKVLLSETPELVARFKQEGQVLARLEHPSLVKVFDLAEQSGHPYLVMELLEGEDLKAVRGKRVLKIERVVEILRVVARTLQHCHDNGIVHRDLKPENVMIEGFTGCPVLVDFGLLKRDPEVFGQLSMDERALSLTQSGEVLGTPSYMAPEQTDPSFGAIGPQTDVYALGALLYFLLTGQAPFTGATSINVILKVMQEPPPNPWTLRPETPDRLAKLCMQAMSKDPAERPESADAFARALTDQNRVSASGSRPWVTPLALATLLAALGVGVAGREGPATPDTGGATASLPTGALKLPPAQQNEPGPPAVADAATEGRERTDDDRAQARALVDQAWGKMLAGDNQGALKECTKAIAVDPSYAVAYQNRASARLRMGDPRGAIEDFTRAIGLDPDYAAAYYNRGNARLKIGDPKAAIDDFTKAIEVDPSSADSFINRGGARQSLNSFQEAIDDYTKAIKLAPRSARAHFNRGVVKSKLGDDTGAALDYEHVLRLNPAHPNAAGMYTFIRQHLGREPK
jgi:tetratricopeptide (TPR) repeat protein/predicted Ser/Thr protein kinase